MKTSMLSRDCDGCSNLKECSKRYHRAIEGDKVYCPDGTAHLIDSGSVAPTSEVVCILQYP
jgi:hypothetical protein